MLEGVLSRLHDLVGPWIPTNHGVVSAIYSPTLTRVEPYNKYVSDPHMLPFTPMFVCLYFVRMRKANNKDKCQQRAQGR